jgi:hypothetical protein
VGHYLRDGPGHHPLDAGLPSSCSTSTTEASAPVKLSFRLTMVIKLSFRLTMVTSLSYAPERAI